MCPSSAFAVDVPRGQRVVIFSDLQLNEPDELGDVTGVLSEIDDAVTVVLTGATARSPQDWANPHPAVQAAV